MKVTIALTAAAVVIGATSSIASGVQQKNMRGTHKDHSHAFEKELNVDIINQLQLEDQTFWGRYLSMSHLGDEWWILFCLLARRKYNMIKFCVVRDICWTIVMIISKRSLFRPAHHLYSLSIIALHGRLLGRISFKYVSTKKAVEVG